MEDDPTQQILQTQQEEIVKKGVMKGEDEHYYQNQSDHLEMLEKQEQIPQLTPEQTQQLQVMQARVMDMITRLRENFREFAQDRENTFVLNSPILAQIQQFLVMWSSRPKKSDKFLLTLQLEDCTLDIDILKKHFAIYPSIKLIVNSFRIQLPGILKTEGQYFYEGNQQFMTIISQANQLTYRGQVKNNQYHGMGMLDVRTKKDGFRYKGHFQYGKRHGKGEMNQVKNILYVGEFKNDYKDGQGMQSILKRKKNSNPPVMIPKIIYTGHFKAGFREGEGTEQSIGVYVYKGEWKVNQKCGYGVIEYSNGDKYKGNWENNQFNGQGQYEEFQNCKYEGEFKRGKYHGNGTITYANGDKYEGHFQNGKKHGQGKYDWENGDYYDGEWKNDTAEGQGSSMFGCQFYNGEFKNGKRNGQGELNTQQGDFIRGIWDMGTLIKQLQRNGEVVQES